MKRHLALAGALLLTTAALQATTDIKPVPFTQVHVTDNFWSQRLETLRSKTIRYAFQKCTDAGQIKNFEIAGKVLSGELKKGSDKARYQSGTTYDDAEVYKVIEGASYLLTVKEDKELEAYIDGVIDLIASAQESDGYLFTNWTIANPLHEWMNGAKWTSDWNLSHETFDMGELIEAGVAYYYATGKDKLLNVARRAADVMCETFKEGGLGEAPGHAVVEMALVRLYEVTGDEKYLNECKYFLDTRGHRSGFDPNSDNLRVNGKYWQNHAKAVDQREAVGHAVRALYFYSGMADWVRFSGDQEYQTAIDAIWDNIESKKLYITGGLGARHTDEAFGENYELPNGSAYCETCASIANCFFNLRMFRLHADGKYIDALERSLYNNVLDGLSVNGDSFYYVNPLEATTRGNDRNAWYGTSCCPTNLCRIIPSMPGYVYATDPENLYVNLYVQSTGDIDFNGNALTLSQTTEYPWNGAISLSFDRADGSEFNLKLRIPGWAQGAPVASDLYTYVNEVPAQPVTVSVNGQSVPVKIEKGYVTISRAWNKGDKVDINLPMEVRQVKANDAVKADLGKLAIERGPIVYCAEFADNNGSVENVAIPQGSTFTVSENTHSGFNSLHLIEAAANRTVRGADGKAKVDNCTITLTPYFSRAYRGSGDMKIWIPTDNSAFEDDLEYIDRVMVTNAESEEAHNMVTKGSRYDANVGWRDAVGNLSFIQYDLAVLPDKPIDLVLTYWGNDNSGDRRFDVYGDDDKFSHDILSECNVDNEFVKAHHSVPWHVSKGKDKMTFKLVTWDNNIVGGIWDVRTVVIPATPDNAKVCDYIFPNREGREAHDFKGTCEDGWYRNHIWCDGRGENPFSFAMKVEPTGNNYAMFQFWGGEWDLRDFDITVDGVAVGHQVLQNNYRGHYFNVAFPIPAELTAGKESVRLGLSSKTGTKVGGFSSCYTLNVPDSAGGVFNIATTDGTVTIQGRDGAIVLDSSNLIEGAASVYTLDGKCIYASDVKIDGNTPLCSVDGGVYLVSFKTSDGTSTAKISL